jgi:8-amino-3,8-dideoxy-alpha-D-manno-octulosonate transaminase
MKLSTHSPASVKRRAPAVVAARIPEPSFGGAMIGKEEEKLVLQVLRAKALFRYYGPDPKKAPGMTAALEEDFVRLIGTRFALGVTSGTAALEVALGALGVGPGDEVIVPAWSWISCFTSVVRLGARPVLAEIDDTLCLDPKEIARLRTARTKAVVVVHFQGVAADMDAILAEAKEAGIRVLEDCAEAPGVLYKGSRVGSLGDIAIFSFQHHKTITSGEGGMVLMNDPKLYERAVRMHDIGQMRPFHAKQVEPRETAFSGSQFRMSELTAAVLRAQLRRLDSIRLHCRAMNGRIMSSIRNLRGLQFRRIPDPKGDSGFEIYFWLDKGSRDDFRSRLDAYGIPCQPLTGTYAQYRRPYVISGLAHAPGATPFPIGAGWPAKGYRAEDFPKTEDLINRLIAIPVGANYSDKHADQVALGIRRIHAELF